jgi:hypothetical protein
MKERSAAQGLDVWGAGKTLLWQLIITKHPGTTAFRQSSVNRGRSERGIIKGQGLPGSTSPLI